MGAEFIRDIEPGEMITISRNGIESNKELSTGNMPLCIRIYLFRKTGQYDGWSEDL